MKALFSRPIVGVVALGGAALLAMLAAAPANADTTLSGPLNLGTATSFSVLAAAAVTNVPSGTTTLGADLGLSPAPASAITGFPPGLYGGTLHATDAVAAQAQVDLTTAYNVAASLTPQTTGLTDLVGLTLTPGVYSGGALSLNGDLTLAGTAESVWVFQASSTLTTGIGSHVILTGGASVCNVFWQVGSSATLGTNSDFVGSILAQESITATTGADISGRLLARTGAVTLDDNDITAPTGCANASGTVVQTSPTFVTSTPSNAIVGTAYSYRVTATGGAPSTYSITSGTLPAGLRLDATTGIISGTPTTPGTYTFTVTANNGSPTTAALAQTLIVAARSVPTLANTGADTGQGVIIGSGLGLVGLTLFLVARSRRRSADQS
jgi:LPXTG-motif cell wall-anchored protein